MTEDLVEAFVDRHPVVAGFVVFAFFVAGVVIERRRRRRWAS